MKYNDLQRVHQYVVGTDSLKSLEVLTGYSGFDNLIVNAPELSDFPDKSNNTKPLHTNPAPPPHPSQSQTNQQTHSHHTSSNSSNTNQPTLPAMSSFEQPLTPSQVPTGMALARLMLHDDPSPLGYLDVKPLGSNDEVLDYFEQQAPSKCKYLSTVQLIQVCYLSHCLITWC